LDHVPDVTTNSHNFLSELNHGQHSQKLEYPRFDVFQTVMVRIKHLLRVFDVEIFGPVTAQGI